MPHALDAVEITPGAGQVTLSIKVVPGASRTRINGVWDKSLRVAVAAPPEGGRANDELIDFLARLFDLKRGDVRIVRGQTQRQKVVALSASSVAAIRNRLRAIEIG